MGSDRDLQGVTAPALHYVDAGEGPPVVMLHGFPEFWYSWRNQIPVLAAAGFHVVAPDLRGYNDSPKPADVASYRIQHLVADVVELIRFIGAPAIVVGHDWGGFVAWYVAMMQPDLVGKLVVLNAPHPAPLRRELRRSLEQKLRFTYQLFFQPPLLPELLLPWILPFVMRRAGRFTEAELRHYREASRKPGAARAMANYYRALRKYRGELREFVKPIEMPTLMIWGERDPAFSRRTTENFGEWVPNLRLERIPDAGHFVQTDAADRVNAQILDFLR